MKFRCVCKLFYAAHCYTVSMSKSVQRMMIYNGIDMNLYACQSPYIHCKNTITATQPPVKWCRLKWDRNIVLIIEGELPSKTQMRKWALSFLKLQRTHTSGYIRVQYYFIVIVRWFVRCYRQKKIRTPTKHAKQQQQQQHFF